MRVLSRQNGPDTAGRISLTPPVQLGEQGGQGEEVRDPEVRPARGEHEEGIGALHVGPAGWQRAHPRLIRHPEEHAVLAPGVGEADELELLAAQGMEGMGDANTPRTRPIRGS